MRKSLTLPFFILVLCAFSIAQEAPTNCPAISVNGPAGHVNVGELATYIARVGDGSKQYSVDYFWTTSAGRIKDGQGTASIRLVQPNAALAVTVEIRGLPPECPATATEQAIYDPPPLAEKFYELSDDESVQQLNVDLIRRTLRENPNNQLYVLAGDVGGANTDEFRNKESAILSMLVQGGVTRDRITIASVYSDVEMFQFWRVPPGATNPGCIECEEAEKQAKTCPEILVTGPAGVTQPGDSMEFTAKLSGTVPAGLTYRWTLGEDGQILEGQGTLRLRVQTPRKTSFNITASFQVLGLPNSCTNTASETAPVACRCSPLLVDEFRRLPRGQEMSRIDNAIHELRLRANSKLFLIEYYGTKTTRATINRRLRSLGEQLRQRHRLRSVDFEIVFSNSYDGFARTKIYIIPPGAENPAP